MQQWPEFVFDAYDNETKNLCDYLRSADRWLNLIQRDQLAELIDRKIHFYGRGRKPGVAPNLTQLRQQFESSMLSRPEPLADKYRLQKDQKAQNKPIFRYQHRTPEMVQRRLKISGWTLAITKVYDRDTKELSDYLRSADLPLDPEQMEDLADLIDRKINIKPGKGRKPGRFTSLAERQGVVTTSVAVFVIKRHRRAFGKTPGVSVEEEIERFANFCSDAGCDVDIDKVKAVASVRRGKPRRYR